MWGVIHTNRVQTPKPTLDGMAYLRSKAPDELAAYEWLNSNIKGIPVILEAHGDRYQEFTRVAMNTGLPTVLGWDYHVFQRGHNLAGDQQAQGRHRDGLHQQRRGNRSPASCSVTTSRWSSSVRVERRVYAGGNLAHFKEWTDLLTPVYQNPGVTVFASQRALRWRDAGDDHRGHCRS